MNKLNRKFTNLVSDISTQTLKTGALLRLLKHRLEVGSDDAISTDDLMASVELCLDTLPHESDDIFDPLEEVIRDYKNTINSANKLREEVQLVAETVYSAMSAIANPNTSIDALTEAGTELYRLAQGVPELEQKWNTWLEIVELRGYAVGWLNFSDDDRRLHLTAAGLPGFKKVLTPGSARHVMAERLSAEKIEALAAAMGVGVEAYIKSALASSPEPLHRETADAN